MITTVRRAFHTFALPTPALSIGDRAALKALTHQQVTDLDLTRPADMPLAFAHRALAALKGR
jgi:hypothetical protein